MKECAVYRLLAGRTDTIEVNGEAVRLYFRLERDLAGSKPRDKVEAGRLG